MKIKHLNTILLILFLTVYIILIVVAFSNIDEIAQTSSAFNPSKPTVVIDAGHGGEDGGAVDNNIVEKDINLSIAKKLADLLRVNGFDVIETRTDDIMINTDGNTLREKKVSDMKNRLAVFDTENSIVISIHQNKFPQSKYHGTQVFYGIKNSGSKTLAENVQSNIVKLIQPDNKRECKMADGGIFLLKNCVNPSIIVECGFISNYEEAQLLSDERYQRKMSFSIFCGLMDYINNRG